MRSRSASATGAVIVAATLILAACGGEDTAADNSAANATPSSADAVSTEPPDTASTAVTPDDSAEPGQIEISTDIQFNVDGIPEGEFPQMHLGTFVVTAGADDLGCESGTSVDTDRGPIGVEKLMTCEQGERVGTFSVSFVPFQGPWTITGATGDFDGLGGSGDWDAQIVDGGAGAQETMSGDIEFVDTGFAEPSMTFPRLNQTFGPCHDGYTTTDGLAEFATVDGVMLRLDLETQEITEHGAPPVECAMWIGDESVGRRYAQAPDGTRAWFGPFDGDWETEIEWDEQTDIISRSFAANRLVMSRGGSALIIDATTGEQIGHPIEGSFVNGRDFTPTATSADDQLIVIGGATPGSASGGGSAFVLDAVSGDEIFRIDTASPASTFIFDESNDELVIGLFTGEILTVDTASGSVVAETQLSRPATIGAIGIRPDGLIVVQTDQRAELIDRLDGPQGDPLRLGNSVAGRIRADGTISSVTRTQQFEIFAFDD